MPIGFIIRGKKQDIIVLAENLQEAQKEFRKHRKEIEKSSGGSFITTSKPVKKPGKVSISKLILELKGDGFLNKPKSLSDITKELAARGHHYAPSSLSWSLQDSLRKRLIGRLDVGGVWKYVKR